MMLSSNENLSKKRKISECDSLNSVSKEYNLIQNKFLGSENYKNKFELQRKFYENFMKRLFNYKNFISIFGNVEIPEFDFENNKGSDNGDSIIGYEELETVDNWSLKIIYWHPQKFTLNVLEEKISEVKKFNSYNEDTRKKLFESVINDEIKLCAKYSSEEGYGKDVDYISLCMDNFECQTFFDSEYNECSCEIKLCYDFTIYCKIIPVLGEEYPKILKKFKEQIRETIKNYDDADDPDGYFVDGYDKEFHPHPNSQGIYILLVKDFQSSTTTRDELRKIFYVENVSNEYKIRTLCINVIFMDELNLD